jgi:hypothetical protein
LLRNETKLRQELKEVEDRTEEVKSMMEKNEKLGD